MTCSSFTSVSLKPPIVSFAVRTPSEMADLMQESQAFAVHLLSKHQVAQSIAFSSPKTQSDFERFSHHMDDSSIGLPILHGCLSVMICTMHNRLQVGDHQVWFGKVERIIPGLGSSRDDPSMEPLLYYESTYRSIGDEVFLNAFEQTTLSFDEWTHRAHVRMAWNYLLDANGDLETTFLRVKEGITRYNDANRDRVRTGFHHTITMFFLRLTALAIKADKLAHAESRSGDFLDFLGRHPNLDNFRTVFKYYSRERLYSPEAHTTFIEPDLQPLPQQE
eukprot:jgi/Hompol1/1573/HPOL_005646-RA